MAGLNEAFPRGCEPRRDVMKAPVLSENMVSSWKLPK